MKKTALHALAFPIMWVVYCAYVLLTIPDRRTPIALSGLVVGALFMYLTGLLMLWLLRGRATLSTAGLVVTFLALVAADQLVKLWVFYRVPRDAGIPLVGNWLAIRFIPNYSNSVGFSLLNIQLSPAFMALLKLVLIIGCCLVLYFYIRDKYFNLQDARFRLCCVLLLAAALCSTAETLYRGYILDFVSFATLVGFDFKDLYMMYGIGLFILVFVQWEGETEKRKRAAAPK